MKNALDTLDSAYAIVERVKGENKKVVFKSVLFDMDGVIVDSLPTHARAAQHVLQRYGYELSTSDYLQNFAGCTDKEGFTRYFERYGVVMDVPALVEEKATEYMTLCHGDLEAFPGVLDFIHELAEDRVALGLVTSAMKAEAELTLDTFGIRDLFGAVVTSADVNNSKPHPEPYLRGAAKLGVSPRACLVVEDATDGVAAAVRAGMKCLAVTNTCSAEDLGEATWVADRLGAHIARELFPVAVAA